MLTLLTFEVFHGTGSENDAQRLRAAIESSLRKLNWEHLAVHTTFVKTWTAAVDNQTVTNEFSAIVTEAYQIAAIRRKMRVAFVALVGPGPAVAADA